jgi:hypothetical protein
MCVLCRDTFSRSDILKRHFQKCCIRRGNPTGISHLSHPHAHVKKHAQQQQQQQQGQGQQGQSPPQTQQQQQPQQQPVAPMGQPAQAKAPGDMGGQGDHMHALGGISSEGIHYGFPVAEGIHTMPTDQSQISRNSSLGRPESGGPAGPDRSASRSGSFNGGYGGPDLPQQLPAYTMPPAGQNGMPMYSNDAAPGHPAALEWTMFQQGEWGVEAGRPVHLLSAVLTCDADAERGPNRS